MNSFTDNIIKFIYKKLNAQREEYYTKLILIQNVFVLYIKKFNFILSCAMA